LKVGNKVSAFNAGMGVGRGCFKARNQNICATFINIFLIYGVILQIDTALDYIMK
jgi:hypothetical protein